MNWICRRLTAILVISFCSGWQVLCAQDGLRLSLADSSTVGVEAGGVGSRIIQIENGSDLSVDSRLLATLPTGWTLLIPPPRFTAGAGKALSQLFSFQVPATTPAGRYSIALSTEGPATASTTMAVEVLPKYAMDLAWIEVQRFARAGEFITGLLSVTNRGNAPSVIRLEVRSSLNYPIRISADRVDLGAGETGQIEITVETRDDILTRQTHSSVVTAGRENEPAQEWMGDSFLSEILPVQAVVAGPREGTLPFRLSLSGSTEEGRKVGQMELALPETTINKRSYEALIRIPDVRNASVFAVSDQYSVKMTTSRSQIRLGDHTYRSSGLLENGTLGFGAGLERSVSKFVVGGYVQRSRKIFPERQQAAGFIKYQPLPEVKIEAHVLSKRDFESGDAISFVVETSPRASSLRAEYALGWFGLSSKKRAGHALEISGSTGYRNSSLSANYESADADFLGSIQNTRGGSGAVSIAVRSWLTLQGQVQAQRRFYELVDGKTANQTSVSARSGLRINRNVRARTFLSLTAVTQQNENTLSVRKREDLALELRAGYQRKRLGLNATITRGQAEDGIAPDLDPYTSTALTANASKGAFSVNVFGSYLKGPTFYNPVKQERIMTGGSLAWNSGSGTVISASVFKSTDLVFDSQDFLLGDVNLIHRLPFEHEIQLRARLASTSTNSPIRDGTFGVTYRIPLFVPAPGSRRGPDRLIGQVVDLESGSPLPNVILTLDSRSVSTDANGHFSIDAPRETSAYLSIDRQSIGLDRRPLLDFPMAIPTDDKGRQPLRIEIVRSAGLQVTVRVENAVTNNRSSALASQLGSQETAGLVVEAKSGETRLRRLVGSTGTAQFQDLVPGAWTVILVESSLPEGYVSQPDTSFVDLEPGQTSTRSMTIKPKSRSIQMVGSGSASLSKVGSTTASKPTEGGQKTDRSAESAPGSLAGVNGLDADTPPKESHNVLPGETLAELARRYYGSTRYWIRIWQANSAIIPNPDLVSPGVTLTIPKGSPLTRGEMTGLRHYATSRR